MKNKNLKDVLFASLGLLITVIGLLLIKKVINPQGIMQTLPYILVGLGCGTFGHYTGKIISYKATANYPDIVKSIEIEQKDERNVLIMNKARGKAYETMIFVYGAIMLSFALMQVDLKFIIILVLAYLFVVFTEVYYRLKFTKEM
jgi:hypothetical protein